MRCQNCNLNEANYHYTSNINGQVSEVHLCTECAGKLGYEINPMHWDHRILSGILDGMIHIAENRPVVFGAFAPRSISGMLRIPSAGAGVMEAERNMAALSPEAEETFRKRRRLNELKARLQRAIEAEDFEAAAELRDQIYHEEKDENRK